METPVHHQMSKGARLITSGAIYFACFTFGLTYNFLSPALVELKNKYGTSVEDISKVFTIILIAYMVGALTCSCLFKYVNRQLATVLLLYTIATSIVAISYLESKELFFAAGGFLGFASGGFDTSQIAWILEMWQLNAGMYVQIQHFSWAVGTMITPLLLKPFLLVESTNSTTLAKSEDPLNNTAAASSHQESRLYIPFSIGGSIVSLAATLIFLLYCFKRYEPPVPTTASTDTLDTAKCGVTGSRKWILVGLTAAFLGCYQGMEVCTFQFLPAFTHYIGLHLPEPEGASILGGLTTAFTVGRLLGIIGTVLKIPPAVMLIWNFSCLAAGDAVLYWFSNNNLTALWVAAVLLGLGFSTIFPCIYDHVEKHFKVTNTVAAVNVVAGACVSAVYPLVVGHLVERNPFVLTYVLIFSVGVIVISFAVLYCLTEGGMLCSRLKSYSKSIESNAIAT